MDVRSQEEEEMVVGEEKGKIQTWGDHERKGYKQRIKTA